MRTRVEFLQSNWFGQLCCGWGNWTVFRAARWCGKGVCKFRLQLLKRGFQEPQRIESIWDTCAVFLEVRDFGSQVLFSEKGG